MSMKMTADLMCTEPEMSAAAFSSSASSSAAVYASSKLQDDERRLQILLDQEDRFVPSGGGSLRHERLAGEQERMRLLETMFNCLCQDPTRNDVYQLAVNLLDRYLSYVEVQSEREMHSMAAGCCMIAMKIRRAQEESLSYRQLRAHFYGVTERSIKAKEKEIATQLKWNLNAVTAADFIEELLKRLQPFTPQSMAEKLSTHSHTLANICLLYGSFTCVPPSLLASACLCDSVEHVGGEERHRMTVETLAFVAGVEPDVLLQSQHNVSDVYHQKLKSCSVYSNTPTDIEDIESQEFGHKFTFEAKKETESHRPTE